MKHIKTQNDNDCAVAAFAMVMSIPYRKAMKILHPKRRFWSRRIKATYLKQIFAGYKRLGYTCEAWSDIDFTKLTCKAIIVVKSGEDQYHAVAWDPCTKTILDPISYYTIEMCKKDFYCAIYIVD